MEISTDGYLHKKFKKQLNTESIQIIKNDQAITGCVQFSSINEAIPVIQNTNDIVPKLSTNNENSFLAKSSISHVGNSVVNIKQEIEELENPQSFNNCISYVISNPGRLENINQRDSPNRSVNFDRGFNILEPIVIPKVETSSILDNVYSKQYVTSKLVSVENLGDISSSSSITCHELISNIYDDPCAFDRNLDNQVLEHGITEKSPGGKYVCSYCNLACSKPSVLQKHIRAHTNERPYPCVSCGFSFKTRSNLYKHCRSRTHANRVMGNKAQEIQIDGDSDSQSKLEYTDNSTENVFEESIIPRSVDNLTTSDNSQHHSGKSAQDIRSKPYKPRFHTAKAFFENNQQFEDQRVPEDAHNRPSNSRLLSLHINEVINKNHAIINTSESYLLRKRSMEIDNVINEVPQRLSEIYYQTLNVRPSDEKRNDEPLNLTNKLRKRCISEVTEPAIQTSLIKELLLKNLYADPNMQCPHCKMIFQTVTELELHKMRSCRAFIKSGARYNRSSSVNVASILTKNKNAFDGIPHLQNTAFPLKSPGPCLGKTRLVENDKPKTFSFDDNLPAFRSTNHYQDILKTTLHSAISPLTTQQDQMKKAPVKLFGGEVKITHTSGETKSYKIDKDGPNYIDCNSNNRLSENHVIKSSLQSGGTVLQNKPSYSTQQDSLLPSPSIIRVYEHNSLSPSIDITNFDKTRFNFDRLHYTETNSNDPGTQTQSLNPSTPPSNCNVITTMYNNYTNIMDFSQKAAKLLAPNLKQPNFTVRGVPVPSNLTLPFSQTFEMRESKPFDSSPNTRNEFIQKSPDKEQHLENIQFAQNQIILQQKMALEPPSTIPNSNCNPVHLFVNGKVIRYVPGMPGPVAADVPLDVAYASNNQTSKPSTRIGLVEVPPLCSPKPMPLVIEKQRQSPKPENRSLLPNKLQTDSEGISQSPKILEIKPSELQLPRLNELRSPNHPKSPTLKNLAVSSNEQPRKFARPNTLALKPSTVAQKQHHGLTPTMFNQILISPDTPRVAKKYMQHFLHGNYFSYLGLKSSTKSVYCTLNKTQPTYVPHFKKLSMYSEWRQQETKGDRLYVSAYDSRQKKKPRYTTAGRRCADMVVHSSYKFTAIEVSTANEDEKASSLLGGYESNDEYTYVRGRGRGRYICDQCGIRCKKPSMLKKHVRTHTNDRPYTCNHCNFSFKTKGNLTKHMKSKAHTKNYAASSGSNSSAQQSGTQSSSDSDSDDSGMDSSDESTRQQEHEAAYGLLSLSQKTTQNITMNSQTDTAFCGSFMNAEQVTQVNNSNFAKNKILDRQITINFNTYNILNGSDLAPSLISKDGPNVMQFLGKTNIDRPLTYPYTSDIIKDNSVNNDRISPLPVNDSCSIQSSPSDPDTRLISERPVSPITIPYDPNYSTLEIKTIQNQNVTPLVKVNDTVIISNVTYNGDFTRKRKTREELPQEHKYNRMNTELEAMDLSMTSVHSAPIYNGTLCLQPANLQTNSLEIGEAKSKYSRNSKRQDSFNHQNGPICGINRENKDIITPETPLSSCNEQEYDQVNISYVIQENNVPTGTQYTEVPNSFSPLDYDNSAMETLADVATKQVKLEKHLLAKNVASEFLKLTAKTDDSGESHYLSVSPKDVNDLIGKPEENKSCTICDKNFNKPSQLRLHMNIHYLERPFRCDPCATSFRTKGHLQKHERSAGHHNKLSSPLLSSSEPRPFKCTDCNVGFRMHGHLAKHLRSKQHIMKLEWLAKIPIGLYAELERANSLLTEINTTDGDQCLESLKALARKVFVSDTSKPNQTSLSINIPDASDF